jgi:hypothetical protein
LRVRDSDPIGNFDADAFCQPIKIDTRTNYPNFLEKPRATNGHTPAATAQAWHDYDEAAKVGTKEAWASFLKTHPTGLYGDLARARLANLDTVRSNNLDNGTKEKNKIDDARLARLIQCCVQYVTEYSRKHPEYGSIDASSQSLVSSRKQQIRNGATHYCSLVSK